MHKKSLYPVLLAGALSLLFVVSFLFVVQYRNLHSSGRFRIPHERIQPTTVDTLQAWMTFSYINHRFMVPDELLRNELTISNTKYPNITIEQVAKDKKKDVALVMSLVKDSLQKHLDSLKNSKK